MKKQREEITIRDLANIFIPKLWLIVLVAVVFGAVVAVNTVFFTEDTYTSYSDTYIYRGADSHASIDEKDEDAEKILNDPLEDYGVGIQLFMEAVRKTYELDKTNCIMEKHL